MRQRFIGLLGIVSALQAACGSSDETGSGSASTAGAAGAASGQSGAFAGGGAAQGQGGGGTSGGSAQVGGGGSPPAGPGILGCVTVAVPASSQAGVGLSPAFGKTCSACHGATGAGGGLYPAIPGKLSLEEFRGVVRAGREAMPAFPADYYSDAQLEADFAALSQGAAAPTAMPDPLANLSAPELEQRYAAGLALWRKADAKGAACASCHTPDAIDLAVIGYGDDAILRRALLHLSVEDSLGVVELVHVQRAFRRHGSVRPEAIPALPAGWGAAPGRHGGRTGARIRRAPGLAQSPHHDRPHRFPGASDRGA